MKEEFYLQGTDFEKEMFHDIKQIRFEWNMLYACNYRCSYCFFEGKWEEYGKRNIYLSPQEWFEHWKRICNLYGRCAIIITGGEPFIYHHFTEIIEKISQIHFPINISTNASANLNDFIEKIDPKKVSLTLSFHPQYDEIEEIIVKIKSLKEKGFLSEFINFCAYPPFLKELNRYIEKVKRSGEKLKVIPYIGKYNGRDYPDGYLNEEKKILGLDEKWEKNVKRKGSLCAAGCKSALIFPDGKVARCGQIGERFLIGSIFSDDFKLLEKPLSCDVDLCPCLETVLVEKI